MNWVLFGCALFAWTPIWIFQAIACISFHEVMKWYHWLFFLVPIILGIIFWLLFFTGEIHI